MIILKVTKKQGITPSLENAVLKKPRGEGLTPSLFRVKTIYPEVCSILIFLKKDLRIVSLLHFAYDFSRKMFLMLYSINVSEYPFKQNKCILKNMKVLLYTCFYNISLNILRPNFFNMYNLPFSRFQISGKLGSNLGQKLTYFSYLMGSCTNRIAVFCNFFSLVCSEPRDKTVPAIFFFSSIF